MKKVSLHRSVFKESLFPAIHDESMASISGAGIWIDEIKDDYSEIKVALKLSFFNSNIFGVHFGGSLYAMVDPFVVTLMAPRLGNKYYCWDYSGKIRYVKPGTELSQRSYQGIRSTSSRH